MTNLEPVNEVCKVVGQGFEALRSLGPDAVRQEIRDQAAIWLPRYRDDGLPGLDLICSVQGLSLTIVTQVGPSLSGSTPAKWHASRSPSGSAGAC